MTQQQVKLWDDDDDYCNDDEYIKTHNGYQKHKDQKAKIEEELICITWIVRECVNWLYELCEWVNNKPSGTQL